MPLNERNKDARCPRAAAAPAKDEAGVGSGTGRLGEAQRARAAKQAILADLDDSARRAEIVRALKALLRQGRSES